ncbi:MAG TPA: hypothetical protein VN750_00895 [Steroidobacteraceae bacterium]|nr:hypothetical protein [Steroidobacteraceae bacterium]
MNALLHSGIPDSPVRTAPPAEDVAPAVPFDELPIRQQLDIASRACRTRYQGAMEEAFSVDNEPGFKKFLAVLLDSSCSDSDVGTTARDLALQYVSRCAAAREDDLSELGG